MPHPDMHAKLDIYAFGRMYPEVHKWIDSTYKNNAHEHWIDYHHEEAICRKYPAHDIRRKVARLHVAVDWITRFNIAFLPRNRQEVIDKLDQYGVWQLEKPT